MARNNKNFAYLHYVDDDGNDWEVRGEVGGAFSAVDGNEVELGHPVFGKQTKRRHTRYIEATDPLTFRKVRGIIYTPTAYATLGSGDTVAVQVPGLATTINYTVSAKIPERLPIPSAARHLTDVSA